MVNSKLTSFSEYVNITINDLNHRKDKHLESLQDIISFLQQELLMKSEIIKSLTETLTVVLDTYLNFTKNPYCKQKSSDAPEIPSNTTLVTHDHHHHHHQQQQQQEQHQKQQQQQQQQQPQLQQQL